MQGGRKDPNAGGAERRSDVGDHCSRVVFWWALVVCVSITKAPSIDNLRISEQGLS